MLDNAVRGHGENRRGGYEPWDEPYGLGSGHPDMDRDAFAEMADQQSGLSATWPPSIVFKLLAAIGIVFVLAILVFDELPRWFG